MGTGMAGLHGELRWGRGLLSVDVRKQGMNYVLPTDLEWEKAARGVDERWFVWGDGFDPSYCHMIDSHQGRRLPLIFTIIQSTDRYMVCVALPENMCDWTSSYWRDDWEEPEKYKPLGFPWGEVGTALTVVGGISWC